MPPPPIHIKPYGGDKILRIRALCGGGKPPPYFIITDISPNRGITPPYPENFISCVGNGLDRSAKRHRILSGEHSSPLRIVGNDLSVVPQSHIKCMGGRGNPPLQRVVENADPSYNCSFPSRFQEMREKLYNLPPSRALRVPPADGGGLPLSLRDISLTL